jgi:hypothetical protein
LYYPAPSLADCDAVTNAEPVENQEAMYVQNFELLMELDDTGVTHVETKIRENLLPELFGCPVKRRVPAEKASLDRRLAS